MTDHQALLHEFKSPSNPQLEIQQNLKVIQEKLGTIPGDELAHSVALSFRTVQGKSLG